MSDNQVVRYLALNGDDFVDDAALNYKLREVRELYRRGGRIQDVNIAEVELSPRFLQVLRVIAEKPISKLFLFGIPFTNEFLNLVQGFAEIIRTWDIGEITFHSLRMGDSCCQAIAEGLKNKPMMCIQFFYIQEINLCNFDLDQFHVQSMEFYASGVTIPRDLQHMRCQRLVLKNSIVLDDEALGKLRGVIERAEPNFHLELETNGVSGVLNEILALNKISVLRLNNPEITEELLDSLAKGIKNCHTLTTLYIYGVQTENSCDMLGRFFPKIIRHRRLHEIRFPCSHYINGERCYTRMNRDLEDTKQKIESLFQLALVNDSLPLRSQLPTDVLKKIKEFVL